MGSIQKVTVLLTSLAKIIFKMKLYLLVVLAVTVSGSPLSGNLAYEKGGEAGYGADYGSGDYGGQKCYPTYETKYKEQCEDYSEKVCYTTQRESCNDIQRKKCKAIQTLKHERKCYDVNEMLCSLKENVQYEEVPAVFTVQKCHKIADRICDTVYETELTERDDFKCINIVNPYCASKEHTIYDKTCRTITHFDCKSSGYGAKSSYSEGSQDSYAVDSYGGSSYESDYKCKRTPETKCYTTPRTVSTQYCEDREEKVCEKLTERVPVPSEKQNCHDDNKTVCDNADQMFLQPSCVPSSRKVCSYHPEEKCENVPKQHCHKIPHQVKKMECSESHGGDGYESKSYGEEHQDYSVG